MTGCRWTMCESNTWMPQCVLYRQCQAVMQNLSSSHAGMLQSCQRPLADMLQSSQRRRSTSGAHSMGAFSHWSLQPQSLRSIGSASKKLSVRLRPYAWDHCLSMANLHSNGGCLLPTLATKRTVSSDQASSVQSLQTSGEMESGSSLKDRMARRSGLKYTSLSTVLAPHEYCNWRFLAVLLQSKLFVGNLSSTLHCYRACWCSCCRTHRSPVRAATEQPEQ